MTSIFMSFIYEGIVNARVEETVVVLEIYTQNDCDVVDLVIKVLEIAEGSIDVAAVVDEEVYHEDILTENDRNVTITIQQLVLLSEEYAG